MITASYSAIVTVGHYLKWSYCNDHTSIILYSWFITCNINISCIVIAVIISITITVIVISVIIFS